MFDDLAVNALLANSSGDQLGVLRSKIEHQNAFGGGLGLRRGCVFYSDGHVGVQRYWPARGLVLCDDENSGWPAAETI